MSTSIVKRLSLESSVPANRKDEEESSTNVFMFFRRGLKPLSRICYLQNINIMGHKISTPANRATYIVTLLNP
ncbi:hypothetical protein HUG17_0317 [Dermatophagoides farinae]|uniref:Uncharacterized protein n=1 Tax=Dermatophagoides farinae TaxID=6954 RepID=A0A9D4P6Y3_DERFA|nr:hypothetical protein HUG17_0317 [Dermatophagoides farinae]